MGMTPDRDNIATQRDHAVAETMETMAFLEVSRCRDGDGPVADALACAIPFVTPYQGHLILAMPTAIAQEIASTLVGSDDDAVIRDTLNEIANTIAGRLLGLVAPGGEPIAVGLPQPSDLSGDDVIWADYRLDDGRCFSVGVYMVHKR